MLLMAPALGLAASRRVDASALVLVPSLISLFLARYAGVPAAARLVQGKDTPRAFLARRLVWTVLYLLVATGLMAMAIGLTPAQSHLDVCLAGTVVLGLGLVQTAYALAGRDRTIPAELAGMAGLAASAPLLMTASGLPLDRRAIAVGALALAYYVSSLALVRAYRAEPDRRRAAGTVCLMVHAGLAVSLVALWQTGSLPLAALVAFPPILIRAVWALVSPPPTLRVLGMREVGVAVTYLAIGILAFTR